MTMGMRGLATATLIATLLAGCVAPPPAQPGPVALVPPAPPPPAPPLSVTANTVLGTPFMWAVKIPGCAVSLLVVGPVSGVYALANQGRIPPEQDWHQEVDRGVDTYCGPPYVAPP